MTIDPNVPVGTALQIGSYAVAADIRLAEPGGAGRDSMGNAVQALAEALRASAGDYYVTGTAPDLSSLLDGTSEDDRRAFLIELTIANPFAPHWFETTKTREQARLQALRRLATMQLNLDIDSVREIHERWRKAVAEEARAGAGVPWQKLVAIGVGGVALAGLAIAAGPLIAAAMPAAAGLNGAAAISAGLAQLGFGSVAAGGLGMTGGLWMLGLAGGAVGAGGTAVSQSALKHLVAAPGSAHLIQLELTKLVLSARLAKQLGWFDASIKDFNEAVDQLVTAIDDEVKRETDRNDPKAPRVEELRRLVKTGTWAGEAICDLLD